ncbi:MAG: Asp-tRNA(Asn)/Glu-tRNA(Gln) amidotransferase subunit GatB [Bifidobacteriaceae bacterium]|jgi:aspartyl-tRNA(Asn)/glutamyl-tRNA(Gln) amidotransferase subunit B|nr:Asp-tRNA(Asn)/Glu-tRNA(Gln) amidotransferase subunit GatB [Bifidobacteriaceae bacterium]
MATEPKNYVDYETALKHFDVVFGIEVHIELSTKTKLFCSAPNAFGAEPNTLISPVSLGLPGALPVLNEKAVEYAIKLGLALNAKINKKSYFARKNYYYPDLTKNYQTSQSDEPTIGEGHLDLQISDTEMFRIDIERAHLEEDAGKNTHVGGAEGRIFGAQYSLVDYNRAGVPLIEIVTKPVFGAGENAPEIIAKYVRELRDIARTLEISDARMERGNVRADINISLSPKGSGKLGIRSETKNVNSFRSIEAAAHYEIIRHASILLEGETVTQETRHWHEATSSTTSGREKSNADDYRYFPEPNLVPVVISDEWIDQIRAEMPELPAHKRARLTKEWGFSPKDMQDVLNADALALVEMTVTHGTSAHNAKKWWLGELSRIAKEASLSLTDLAITPENVAEIQKLIDDGKVNDKIARKIITDVIAGKGTVAEIVANENLEIVSDDSALKKFVQEALAEQPDVAEKLRNGNMQPIGVIIGIVMKKSQGKADAKKVREIILAEK